MKTIEPFGNTPTVVHVKELPPITGQTLDFGFNIGKYGEHPTLHINVSFSVSGKGSERIKIATYDSHYKIKGEGLIVEDHLYQCCLQAVHGMKIFLRFDPVGKTIPLELIQNPEREAFESDLTFLAKALNAIEGKRGFPSS